jgi:hypothetical protein
MSQASPVVYECRDLPVAVARREDQLKVVATELIPAGAPVIEINGFMTDTPSRFSVQIGANRHIDLDDPALVDANPERYLWRFLNHRCEPNAFIRGRELIALETIAEGDEVTFNYNANEYEMATPFECWCAAHRGEAGVMIRGYKFLSETERFALRSVAAEHVVSRAQSE